MRNTVYAKKMNRNNTIGVTIPNHIVKEMGIDINTFFKIEHDEKSITYKILNLGDQ